mgnify:CR=1 FL=1
MVAIIRQLVFDFQSFMQTFIAYPTLNYNFDTTPIYNLCATLKYNFDTTPIYNLGTTSNYNLHTE